MGYQKRRKNIQVQETNLIAEERKCRKREENGPTANLKSNEAMEIRTKTCSLDLDGITLHSEIRPAWHFCLPAQPSMQPNALVL